MGFLFVAIFAAAPYFAKAAPDPKVTICHYPPGNSSNPQTIIVGASAVKAHLGNHPLDAVGPCANNCNVAGASCNDNNACTSDSCNASTGQCLHTAVNCSDGNSCTTDSCNTATGCTRDGPVQLQI